MKIYFTISLIIFGCTSSHPIESMSIASKETYTFAGILKPSDQGQFFSNLEVRKRIWYNEAIQDTSYSFLFNDPILELPVDTLYFVYSSGGQFKCLLKTKFSNPIVYIESDSLGKYTMNDQLGDRLFNLKFHETSDSILLSFNIFDDGHMNLDYKGRCSIKSSKRNNLFSLACDPD
jgi:hypothetical protein